MKTTRAMGMIGTAAGLVVLFGFAGEASGQTTTPFSHRYHLRAGSTEQEGCFGACLCPVSAQQPMRGTFVLTRTGVDPLFTNYSVTDVHWRTPAFNETITGTGTYRIGGEFALVEQMTLDGSINGATTRHWDSGVNPVGPGRPFPLITVQMRVPDAICFNWILTVRATPLGGDWDGDGNVVVGDIFGFLNDWFAGDGDANEDGTTTLDDVFQFLNDWFAGT